MTPRILIAVFLLSSSALASTQTASVTKLMGSVQLFTHPSKTPPQKKNPSDGSMALFQDEYFLVREAKVGDQVEEGNILRTKMGSRARVVYENGDQILVAPGTAYRIHWEPKTEAAPALDLMYGKVRGVVSKDGPRGKFTIRTKAATLGVRGTDFFVSESAATGETTVSVIRGAVEVKPTAPQAKPVEVKMGFSATAAAATPVTSTAKSTSPAEIAKIELKETSKEEFAAIEKVSVVPTSVVKVDAQTQKSVEVLEKKAITTTAKDIQNYQPELFAKMSGSLAQMKSVEDLNSKSVSSLVVTAPSRPVEKKKPSRRDFTDDEEDPYRQYFKPVN